MKSAPLSEHISGELRDEILRGRYRSGERLPSERDLARRFDVNRGAVREALRTLEQLGLASIQAGGTRVNPVEEASLDVVEHLLALSDPPDPRVVAEVFEVVSGVMGLALRLCVQRADEAQRGRAVDLLQQLSQPVLSTGSQFELFQELGDVVVEASGNTVLMLVHRGLLTQFLGKLHDHQLLLSADSEDRLPIVKELARAIEEQDGPGATEAAYHLSATMRKHAIEALSVQLADQTAPERSTS